MAKKPTSLAPPVDHENLTKIEFKLEYDQSLLLPSADAAELLRLLSKGYLYTMHYSMETATVDFQPKSEFFRMAPLKMDTFTHVVRAQTLGVSFKEYMDQINKENNNDNDA